AMAQVLAQRWTLGMHLGDALHLAVAALNTAPDGAHRSLDATGLEVAVLDRARPRRTFRRIPPALLAQFLSREDPITDLPQTPEVAVTTSGNPVPQHHELTPGEVVTNPQTQHPDHTQRDGESPQRG
ncbi:MAG: proteasome subunit alpha, partial [Micrococcales bacterium]|nr:proteasome subunit alpha [Micrococcales bacterium]